MENMRIDTYVSELKEDSQQCIFQNLKGFFALFLLKVLYYAVCRSVRLHVRKGPFLTVNTNKLEIGKVFHQGLHLQSTEFLGEGCIS